MVGVSGAAGATSVVLGQLGPGCVFALTWVFGKNNLVPTVTASFDALEAGGTVEGLFDFMGRLRGRPFAVRWFVVQVFLIVLFFARRALSAVFGIVCVTHPPTACPEFCTEIWAVA